jgi:hypothetical protein
MQIDEKACPKCAEAIKSAAVVCKHCGFNLAAQAAHDTAAARKAEQLRNARKGFGIIVAMIAGLIIFGMILNAAGFKSAVAPSTAPTPGEQTSAAGAPAIPEKPAPNYTEHRGAVYYYSGSVSENDKKDGTAVGAAVGFRYLGKTDDGDFVIQHSTSGVRATCADPCAVIHLSTGQAVTFEPTSIIGAAMTDAINGNLEASPRTKHK